MITIAGVKTLLSEVVQTIKTDPNYTCGRETVHRLAERTAARDLGLWGRRA